MQDMAPDGTKTRPVEEFNEPRDGCRGLDASGLVRKRQQGGRAIGRREERCGEGGISQPHERGFLVDLERGLTAPTANASTRVKK